MSDPGQIRYSLTWDGVYCDSYTCDCELWDSCGWCKGGWKGLGLCYGDTWRNAILKWADKSLISSYDVLSESSSDSGGGEEGILKIRLTGKQEQVWQIKATIFS